MRDELYKRMTPYLKPMKPIPTAIEPEGGLKSPPACILFDVYGTLFISGTGDISIAGKTTVVSAAFRSLLQKFHIQAEPQLLLKAFFEEIRIAHGSAKKKGIDYPEVRIDRIWSAVLDNDDMSRVRQFALEFELIANPVYPMPHLASVLSDCRKAGIILGIISNAQFYTPLLFRWFLKADLTDVGFIEDLLFYSYRTGYAKPSLKMFELAAHRLGEMNISPETTVYVGNDLKNDIIPAKQTGFQTALFAGDARSFRSRSDDPACEGIHADLVITDLRQLLTYIE